MRWQHRYMERFYRSRPGWLDGNQEFLALCDRVFSPGSRVLETGPGSGSAITAHLKARGIRVVGLDVDGAAAANPYLHEFRAYDGRKFPFEDASFDGALADYVIEHLEDPSSVLREVARVLRPGAPFVFRTPNRYHYVALASRVLPDRLSVWARRRDSGHRTYKKYFRCNTSLVCSRTLVQAGLRVGEIRLIEKEPSYGFRSRLLFLPMLAYERIVNRFECLRYFRANILGLAWK